MLRNSPQFSAILHAATHRHDCSSSAPGAKLLVEFYAPWCGHCKKLEPQWKTANRLLDEAREDDAELGAQLAVVDAIAEKALADRFGVRGYPAIKWFSRGKVRDYKGARTARAIANYVIRHGGPVVRDVANATVLEAFKLSHRVVAVASLAAGDGAVAEHVVDACERADVPLGVVGGAPADGLVLYRAFDEPRVEYGGDLGDGAAVRRWVGANAMPLVVEYSEATQLAVFEAEVELQAVLAHGAADDFNAAALDKLRGEFRAAAASLRGEALFLTLDASAHEPAAQFLFPGLRAGTALPALTAFDRERNYRWPLEGSPLDASSIESHLRAVLSGEARPKLRSAAAPPAGDEKPGAVRVLVGDTYEGAVLARGVVVLVCFCVPWAGRCKELAPTYDALARKYAGDAAVVIARLDTDENEVLAPPHLGEPLDEHGRLNLPRLYLFPADAASLADAVEMETEAGGGSPSLDALAAFVERWRPAAPAEKGEL